jgi:hypothetical protein
MTKRIQFDPRSRIDRVTLAVGAVDGFTGAMVRSHVSARVEGLTDRPITSASGLLVFNNLPRRPHYDVEVDGRRAGFPLPECFRFVPPAPGDTSPSAARRDVPLAPGPAYPFPPATTLLRGVVTRGSAPVSGATISAALAGGGATSAGRSVPNGAFALAVRLPQLGPPEAEAPVPVTITVTEGGDARSFIRPVSIGRSHSFTDPLDLAGGNDPPFFIA